MRRRDKASGKAVKTRRKKTSMHRSATKTVRRHSAVFADLQDQLDRRTRELNEALEQQTATSEVLKVISRSAVDLETVLDTLVQTVARLCRADQVYMFHLRHDLWHLVADYGLSAAAREFFQTHPFTPGRGSTSGRAALERRAVLIPDVLQDPEYTLSEGQVTAGYRTTLAIPLIREDKLIGVYSLARTRVEPFTDKEVELAATFADQAVIAIENVRLFEAEQQRTRELSESLEQQTATSEVLSVISSSAGELQPVFETMLAKAIALCEASFGAMWLVDGDGYRTAALHGDLPGAYVEQWRSGTLHRPKADVPMARAIRSRKPVHVPDMLKEKAYLEGDPLPVSVVNIAGIRSLLTVPMLEDGEAIGVITIYRKEVRSFTDKQIELVSNFAKQAVIAIQNARLVNELRESLQHQTATSEILASISGALTDPKPVFDVIVRNLLRLFGTCFATIQLLQDGIVEMSAVGGEPGIEKITRLYPRALDSATAGGQAMLCRQVVQYSPVVGNPLAPPAAQQIASEVNYNSIIAAPMIRQDKVIGAIICAHREQRVFSEKEVALIRAFADQAVIAIENVRLFDELQGRTRELAASLDDLRTTQDRLVQTQKLALLGQLTAGIAHEIKNPLNFVNNFSGVSAEMIDELQEALEDVSLTEKKRSEISELIDTLRGNFDKVVHHGRRADAIVKNMLQHSREGSGEHRVVGVNALVEESLNLAWHGARAETQGFEIKLKQSFDPSTGEADIFPQDIRRALLNMISNGFYAAAKRRAQTNGGDYEPTLTASTKNLGERVEIRIRDNGTGMAPDVKEKMFNPFFTTKPTGEGTGLGLSISHDIIVKQHGGSIEVDTQPGEFTEITVILPRVAAFV
jgi:signal transduction histidine kinase